MVSKLNQETFVEIAKSKLTSNEQDWINEKINMVSNPESGHKFNVYFSLVNRFIDNDITAWDSEQIDLLERIYPGFSKSVWSKQDLARVMLMTALDISINKSIITSFFQTAEIKEQVALYKGLYFLINASEFEYQVTEGIRTNMANVFDAIASGNPFPETYLEQEAWNQMILKSFFMDRKLYNIQNIDKGKNQNLADMLQDYVKERWAAGRQVSLEIWRMVDGYLRDDIKALFLKEQFEGTEKEVIDKLLNQKEPIPPAYWDGIGKMN